MCIVKNFRFAKKNFANIDADAAAALVTAASDMAMVLDASGIVRDVAFNNDDLANDLAGAQGWVGTTWISHVARDSAPKVEALLARGKSGATAPRHVNYPTDDPNVSIPVMYSTVALDDTRIIAFGRDLRPLSALQRKLVDAQRSLDRDYTRLRQIEARHHLLFDGAPDAVLVADARTHKLLEANPAAVRLLGAPPRRLIGRPLADFIAPAALRPVADMLAAAIASGRADEVDAKLLANDLPISLAASVFHQDDAAFFLIRLTPPANFADAANPLRARLLKLVEAAPDGYVVSDAAGAILSANAAFLAMVNMPGLDTVLGQPLDRWLGRSGVEAEVLMASLRQRGTVRLFATNLRAEQGSQCDVEISAVALANDGHFGFAIRDVTRRLSAERRPSGELPRSVAQLTELIGRVSLKEVVRETTDVIERLCIETALQMTGDNRAAAAEILGLSRQSLYVKLRRFGIIDVPEDAAGSAD